MQSNKEGNIFFLSLFSFFFFTSITFILVYIKDKFFFAEMIYESPSTFWHIKEKLVHQHVHIVFWYFVNRQQPCSLWNYEHLQSFFILVEKSILLTLISVVIIFLLCFFPPLFNKYLDIYSCEFSFSLCKV